jgi:hypothetical protein
MSFGSSRGRTSCCVSDIFSHHGSQSPARDWKVLFTMNVLVYYGK